ncbi:MAG: ferritin-like domain-containing protein [Deltaproteobacteria bacterium]|nr:ferritin-like domain-containing protein [Deltaproteobacteria bacterium]
MSDEHVSRRKALTGGAAALAGVTAALAVSAVTRNAHADNASDATALNAVRTKAFEIIAVYDTLIGPLNREPMTAASGALLTHFQVQHRAAAERLGTQITALGGTPIAESAVNAPTAPTGFTRTGPNSIKYAANLERAAAVANVARLNAIGSKDAAELVAAIVGTQTQHFTVLYLLARGIAGPGAMAASMLNEIVPRSFVSIEAAPAVSLTSVADLTFTA